MPAVDVVIPCYRYGRELPTAVQSVLAQDGVDLRVLIIDDASGDGSADIARTIAAADDRVEVREHSENRGYIATFNEGVDEWASAEYIALLDADDALAPGALARATQLLVAHPEVGFAYGRVMVWDGATPIDRIDEVPAHYVIHDGRSWLRRRYAQGFNCVSTPTVVMRTSVQKRVGGYDPNLPHTADFQLWMRYALVSDVGYLSGPYQALWRDHATNMSRGYDSDGGLPDLRYRLRAFLSVLDLAGDSLPDAAALESQVRRNLEREAIHKAGRAYGDSTPSSEEIAAALIDFARANAGNLARMPEFYAMQLRRALTPRQLMFARAAYRLLSGQGIRRRRRHRLRIRAGI
jgi:glycosyltransferase involved in cell wall biosynthesis